jgi:hypothetical protein
MSGKIGKVMVRLYETCPRGHVLLYKVVFQTWDYFISESNSHSTIMWISFIVYSFTCANLMEW